MVKESNRISLRLYKKLVFKRLKLTELVSDSNPHKDQFNFNDDVCWNYKGFYMDLISTYTSGYDLPAPPGNKECRSCERHFLQRQPKIDHNKDIQTGIELEAHFSSCINEIFDTQKLPLKCVKADVEALNMPDFKVVNINTGEVVFFFEFKCIFKPFIRVNSKIEKAQCYSHSMTLDCDQKLDRQLYLIKKYNIIEKTAYVYWYDIPCVKGVFWTMSKDVMQLFATSQQYARKVVDGDFRVGRKTGHSDKIYLPLHSMNNFDSLITKIKNCI